MSVLAAAAHGVGKDIGSRGDIISEVCEGSKRRSTSGEAGGSRGSSGASRSNNSGADSGSGGACSSSSG